MLLDNIGSSFLNTSMTDLLISLNQNLNASSMTGNPYIDNGLKDLNKKNVNDSSLNNNNISY